MHPPFRPAVRCLAGPRRAAAALLAVALLLPACRRPPPAFAPPPPPDVAVENPRQELVPETMEFTGVTRGVETVEIRARVRGFLEKKHVQDGRRVKQGELLFTIDPRTFIAALKQAEADVAAREADLKLAEVTLTRTGQAAASDAISRIELDRAQAQRDGAKAQLEQARARLQAAQLDVEFTEIRSPIAGRIGFIHVDEGQLVGAVEPTLLATVINDQTIYATYDMDEHRVLEVRRLNQNRRPGEDGRPDLEVDLGLANEQGYPHKGRFARADNTVNPLTGTVRIEAIFDNPDGTILPGSYVRIQPRYGDKNAWTIPDIAVLADQRGKFVYVVDKDSKVDRRDIQVGDTVNRRRIILEGLTPDDRVIVRGVQRARPGIAVHVLAEPPAPPASPAPGAKPE